MSRLYMVATPIGNLEDITLRALRVLAEADVILAEDTRQTHKLVERFKIQTPVKSYHQHSTDKEMTNILSLLEEGKELAVVTDAGTPAISDPGGKLVEQVRAAGYEVIAIPGPSSLTAFLSIAGIPADEFTFLGFLPKKKGRETLFKSLEHLIWPIVMFASPYQLVKTLKDIQKFYPDTRVVVGRELTKKFEEVWAGPLEEGIKYFEKKTVKGEVVLAITR